MAELDDTAEQLRQDQATLGVAPTAEAIRAAYRRKARECHPDHGGSEEEMIQLTAAYSRLIDRADRGSADPPSASATPPRPDEGAAPDRCDGIATGRGDPSPRPAPPRAEGAREHARIIAPRQHPGPVKPLVGQESSGTPEPLPIHQA